MNSLTFLRAVFSNQTDRKALSQSVTWTQKPAMEIRHSVISPKHPPSETWGRVLLPKASLQLQGFRRHLVTIHALAKNCLTRGISYLSCLNNFGGTCEPPPFGGMRRCMEQR